MEFTIIQIRSLVVFDKDSKQHLSFPGWAFLDCKGKTIIQCYGESKKESIEKHLTEN